MGSATEVIEIALAAGGLFTVITVGIIAGVTGLALAAPAAAVALVITAATGCQQQKREQKPDNANWFNDHNTVSQVIDSDHEQPSRTTDSYYSG